LFVEVVAIIVLTIKCRGGHPLALAYFLIIVINPSKAPSFGGINDGGSYILLPLLLNSTNNNAKKKREKEGEMKK